MQQLPLILSIAPDPRLARLPAPEQPVRRVADRPSACNRVELLAALIGGPNQLETAEHLLAAFGSLRAMTAANLDELVVVQGIGQRTAIRVRAALELGMRLAGETPDERPAIHSPAGAAALVLIHARAVLINFTAYPQPPLLSCPKGIPSHALSLLPEMCARLWWHDLPGQLSENGQVLRQVEGGTVYHGHSRPKDVIPIYQHGVFLYLSINNLVVIQGGEATERNYEVAFSSGLPVYLEEE